jgi:predicted aspartyl protease
MPENNGSFTIDYLRPTKRLITEVSLFRQFSENPADGIAIKALWDTGATISCITPDVAKKLGLVCFDKLHVYGVNSFTEVDVTIASIVLPGAIVLRDKRITISFLPPTTDMLIGMDIILMGDLAISNGSNQTLLSFTMPPLPYR